MYYDSHSITSISDFICFFFKHKTAYYLRFSYGSSDVCSSDLSLSLLTPDLIGDHTLGIRKPPYFVIASGAKQSRVRANRSGLLRSARNDGMTDAKAISEDRKSVVWGKRVSVRVDIGGRRIINKKTGK